MSLITHLLNQPGKIIHTAKDKHGDQGVSSEEAIDLRFRYVTALEDGQNREGIISDAIIWVEATQPVVEGTILFADSKYWRVDRLIKARKMAGAIEFLKLFVNKHEI